MSVRGLEGAFPLVLAPLEDITDGPFRRLARRFGADLVYSEFVSADGLTHGSSGCREKLRLTADEHPIAIQVCGSRIGPLIEAARMAEAAGADCVDLNFGCPARKVAGKGAGAGLLREPEKIEAIAAAAVAALRVPVTAKIRLGWDAETINAIDVSERLARAGVAAIALHARTRSQAFGGQADWRWIARVKASVPVAVIGNGDVREPEDAARMFRETGCDAVMIGRAAMGNPWIFSRTRRYLSTGVLPDPPGAEERFQVLLAHLNDAAAEKGERRAVIEMRKLYRGYLRGLPGAARLRAELMSPVTIEGVRGLIEAWAPEPVDHDHRDEAVGFQRPNGPPPEEGPVRADDRLGRRDER
ncbi:MAG: tRNA dihydrouridine synthase DusB [Candidatus Eisenbacteria bacterium]|nr:tRNA dihydrouridine synthase DusB [Candidatus Eisenbacteria bacterium]